MAVGDHPPLHENTTTESLSILGGRPARWGFAMATLSAEFETSIFRQPPCARERVGLLSVPCERMVSGVVGGADTDHVRPTRKSVAGRP